MDNFNQRQMSLFQQNLLPTIQVQHCFQQLEVRGRPSKPYNGLQAGSSGRTTSDCRQVSTSLNTVQYYSPILQSYIGYLQNSPISDNVPTGTVLNRQTGCGATQRIRFSFHLFWESKTSLFNRFRCGCPCPSNFSLVEATSR